MAAFHSPDRSTMTTLTVPIQVGGTSFTFRLCHRSLNLGLDLPSSYYWMDSSEFRLTRNKRKPQQFGNFHTVTGHWWRCMEVNGWHREPDQIIHFLLANLYGLVAGDKALQHVYRDSYLAKGATKPEEYSLDDSVRNHLGEVVRSQNRLAIGAELDQILGHWRPSDAEVHETFSAILSHVYPYLKDGINGLEPFLSAFENWLKSTRRRGGQPLFRRVLDGISYLAKCSFYLCYANCWIDLIPWLREHQGLDMVSERVLRFWHMQNQPLDLGNGIALPDVFRGQVLSLHPLSGFLMKDPGLCAVAGQFFGSDAYDRVFHQGQVDVAEYWKLVDAILTAGHFYRQSLEEQSNRRGVRKRSFSEEKISSQADLRTPESLLEEFAAAKKICCITCKGSVRLDHYQPDPNNSEQCLVHFSCPTCHCSFSTVFDRQEMSAWFGPG